MKFFKLVLVGVFFVSCGEPAGENVTNRSNANSPSVADVDSGLRAKAEESPVPAITNKIPGRTLNETAISLPPPEYSNSLRRKGIRGKVAVQVFVDKTGAVVSAIAISGPQPLRPAAVAAARQAKIEPLLVYGDPKEHSGVLTYDFPPRKF